MKEHISQPNTKYENTHTVNYIKTGKHPADAILI